ncbi:MAG: hypothetical protein RLZZ200_1744 [Pseudomonadota bacterium]|jgi:assimilatory nitrate reductase catalytic subunit
METRSTCAYCGVGCGVIIEHDDTRITGVRGDPDHPANRGRLCTKGSTLHLTARGSTRLEQPRLREHRDGERRDVDWDSALSVAADRLADIIREHGPESVAFYVSGQLLTEDYYVFNKLVRTVVGTNQIDTNSRLCMSSAVSGYKRSLGSDCVPGCYDDIDHADLLFIAGANPAWAHPVLYRRIEAARAANPGLRTIVVDPRRTDTARDADLHLQILPGTDIALFLGMLHVLIWEGFIDRRFIDGHTEGFEVLRERVRDFTPAVAAGLCGITPAQLVEAAQAFGRARAVTSLWCQGLNQSSHGTDANCALLNLHLATGQIGRPGAGPLSLTGQPNAMGGREVGAMATLLTGHRDLARSEDREAVARFWGVDSVPDKPGLPAVELFDAMHEGRIKAVWIACTNPAQSLPDQLKVEAALRKAEFVVVQEAFADAETAAFADLLLPAATWGEKSGTVTNSERCISRVRPAVPPPGAARADWWIATSFARALGRALGREDDIQRLFPWQSEAEVYAEHAASTQGRDLDIAGLSHQRLDQEGSLQWPVPDPRSKGTARLFTDLRFAHADGRARFVDTPHRMPAERVDARHPFSLNTGRLRDQWHGMTRTGTVGSLFQHTPEPAVHVHPADLARRRLASGDIVSLRSRRGELRVQVVASDEQAPGQLYMPMHWGRRSLAGGGANRLVAGHVDPVSRQPEFKHTAVRLERLELPWSLYALLEGDAAQLRPRLQPFLGSFDWASVVLVSGHSLQGAAPREAVVFRARAALAPDPALIESLAAALGLSESRPEADGKEPMLRYVDAGKGVVKRARFDGGRLVALLLAGESAAAAWIQPQWASGDLLGPLRRRLFAPSAQAPASLVPASRMVCLCHGVSESQIRDACGADQTLEGLQERLKCGTSCGSCMPELRRLLAESAPAA